MRRLSLPAALITVLAACLPASLSPPAAGAGAGYRLESVSLPDGSARVARWNPCQSAITYKVNVRGIRGKRAKRSAVRVTKASVARVVRATGLPLAYAGRTRAVPRRSNLAGQRAAELVIAFVRPAQTDLPLGGRAAAYGGWQASYARTARGDYSVAITRGHVVVDHPQTRRWRNGIHRRGITRANLISHELGHAIGLEHVHNRSQLMNASILRTSPAGYGEGDRRGLYRVGRAAGCVTGDWNARDLS